MASLLARALMEDHRSPEGVGGGHHGTRGDGAGVDRVLLATFWRPASKRGEGDLAPVISIHRSRRPAPTRG